MLPIYKDIGKMKNIKFGLVVVLVGVFSSSCVSNYVVSSNAYNPNPGTQDYFTVTGAKIPKASQSIKNQFEIDDSIENIQLVSENLESIELPTPTEETNIVAIPYKAYSVIEEAKTYLGTPYRFGGTTRRGIDCSAFTQSVFRVHDINLPRVARLQAHEGITVSKSELQKGDLLFFVTRGRYISHVGIVESIDPDGEIKFIHASSSQGVTISSLSSAYWANRYRYAKRVI